MFRALLCLNRQRLGPWKDQCWRPWPGNSPRRPRRRSLCFSTRLVPALVRWTTQSSTPSPARLSTVTFSFFPPDTFVAASYTGRILYHVGRVEGGIVNTRRFLFTK